VLFLALGGAQMAVGISTQIAFSASQYDLTGCSNDGTFTLPNASGQYICPDNNYTNGNLGKNWNELDHVPYRLTTSGAGSVSISADYQNNNGYLGYDLISVPTLNRTKSDPSCQISAGPQMIQGSVISRDLTITQAAGTTCVFDYYERLARGSYQWSGSSLHSYLSGGQSIPINVGKPAPIVATQAASSPPNGIVGQQLMVMDTASVSSSQNPTGSVTFTLYSDTNCTQVVPGVSGSGAISNGSASYSTSWTPSAVGTYYWLASYGGDINNTSAKSTCGDANEQIVIGKASSSITTRASPTSGRVGQQLSVTDAATITGGDNPTGSVSFTLYSDTNCTQAVSGLGGSATIRNGTAGSTPTSWTPSATGTYSWIASYAGDTNNTGFTTRCRDANEQIVIGRASPSITTQASPTSGIVGQQLTVADTATITGGDNPTGSVSFTLYSDTNCTQAVSGLGSSATISNGTAISTPTSWTPSASGTYSWIATYPGDSNNTGFTTGCGAAKEQIVISQASPSITTRASPTSGSVGQQLSVTDTATMTGGDNPTGSVTFTLYSDTNCTQAVSGVGGSGTISNSSASSAPTSWTPNATGTYSWIASYPGDADNASSMTGCGDPNEQIVISQARPSIATSASPTGGSVGQQIALTDTASITGGSNPSGSVSFTLYSDTNCTQVVSGVGGGGTISNGSASYSTSWTPSATGTYSWIASYSGDSNNAGFTTGCVDPNEQIVIGQANPTIATQASPSTGSIGKQLTVSDTATISGGNNPSGSVTFTLYNDTNCTQAVSGVGCS
jgi:hypothetical protein